MSRHEQQTPGKDPRFDSVRDTWYWKLSKPLRVVVHFFIRMRNAYIHYGGLKGMWKRFLQKKFEGKKVVKMCKENKFDIGILGLWMGMQASQVKNRRS